ncbi:MAG: MlaD family protein, partial [Nocardioidaceae bacterium]
MARATARSLPGSVGRKALGVAFLSLLAASGWLTYATFDKQFVEVVPVTLHTSKIGLQMEPLADVKIRGVLVGEVRELRSDGTGAVLELALDPERVGAIPENVSA